MKRNGALGLFLALALLLSSVSIGLCEADMWKLVANSGPAARYAAAMVYDDANGNTVLYGGSVIIDGQSHEYHDTWIWDGVQWTEKNPANHPSACVQCNSCYDPVRGQVILFGGTDTTGTHYDDMWAWDGNEWTEITGIQMPGARYGAGFAWDYSRGYAVLFGGGVMGTYYNDTWTWDGSQWTQKFPSAKPSIRATARMAYDERNGRILLTGGYAQGSTHYNDTWTWDGSTWSNLNPSPAVRSGAGPAMVYHVRRRSLILFGGSPVANDYSNETWEWNGSQWTNLTSTLVGNPGPRFNHSMVYDKGRDKVVLFGGYDGPPDHWTNETWEFGALCGDIDGDGDVDATDAMFLEQYLVGLRDSLPCN